MKYVMSADVYHCTAIGAAVKQARNATGMSQHQYGQRCNPRVHKTTVAKIESGEPVQISKLKAAAVVAGVDLKEFLITKGTERPSHEFYVYLERVASALPADMEVAFAKACWELLCQRRTRSEAEIFGFL